MNDLKAQYSRYKHEIDTAIQEVIDSTQFIGGPLVKDFETDLAAYIGAKHIVSCANGTDALQIALMALGLQAGDEVITTAFSFAATAEVIKLLGLKVRFADIDTQSFCLDISSAEKLVTEKTKCIIPVHLFGQCADMEAIIAFAHKYDLYVIEDNAQALGSHYTMSSGIQKQAGTIGHIGTTSFFPSKNLGCYGDGGALMTDDADLAQKLRMICNHGTQRKYYHQITGVNSRLDALQSAILKVKLRYLQQDIEKRMQVASWYDEHLDGHSSIKIPYRTSYSSHTFHQYTILVDGDRDEISNQLKSQGISTAVYYPVPLHLQEAFQEPDYIQPSLPVSEYAANHVLSLPIFPDMTLDQVKKVVNCL